jgi:hypothetical protein
MMGFDRVKRTFAKSFEHVEAARKAVRSSCDICLKLADTRARAVAIRTAARGDVARPEDSREQRTISSFF